MLNILIVGVGGQGTLLASRVLGALALAQGNDVKVSEVHGMAQRGGSVVTHVRIGEKVHAPLVEMGEADIIIAFELLEALRYIPFLKKDGNIFYNEQRILPMPVISGAEKYPEDIQERMQGVNQKSIDALSIAKEVGNLRTVNMVLLGFASKKIGYKENAWLSAIENTVPQKTIALNRQAFLHGREKA